MFTPLRYALLTCALVTSILSTGPAQAAEPPPANFADLSQINESIGKRYFTAYINKDWDTLEPLLAENGSFEDPTATLVFGAVAQSGRAAMLKNFRENYGAISMRFDLKREMFAADHALFEGELNWTYQLPKRQIVTEKMPMVILLKIENGVIVSHRDFADYRPFIEADQHSRNALSVKAN